MDLHCNVYDADEHVTQLSEGKTTFIHKDDIMEPCKNPVTHILKNVKIDNCDGKPSTIQDIPVCVEHMKQFSRDCPDLVIEEVK